MKEDLEYKLNNVLYSYKTLKESYDRVCEALNLATDKNQGDYWAWQGDGYDYIESLSCPVLIPAECLRQLIDKAYTEGLQDGYMLQRKYK